MDYVLHFVKAYIKWTIILWAVLFAVAAFANDSDNPTVKRSNSGICHATDSRYYAHTKNFTAYDTLTACIADGGRLPKNYKISE